MPGLHTEAWHARDVLTTVDAAGGRILLHLPSGTYLGLDRAAARIVDLLNEDPDPDHAARVIADRFDVPFEQARRDVTQVITSVRSQSAPRTTAGRRPTAAGMSIVTRTWLRLPWRHRITVAHVTAVVVAIEVGLAAVDLARLARWMGVPLDTGEPTPPGSDDVSVLGPKEQGYYWAVDWVLTRWLYDGTCLRRALTLGWFVRRRHPVLRLGMIDDDSGIAHAWIEVDGAPLGTTPVSGAFVAGSLAEPSKRPPHDGGQVSRIRRDLP